MVPQWQGTFEAWTRKWAKTNAWRTATILGGEEDLVQECALVFAQCARRYGKTVDNPAWFMALYRRCVYTHMIDLARADSRHNETHDALERTGEQHHDQAGPLLVGLGQCSAEVRIVLDILARAPAEMWDALFQPRPDEIMNRRIKRLCRIAGSTADIVGELRELLTT